MSGHHEKAQIEKSAKPFLLIVNCSELARFKCHYYKGVIAAKTSCDVTVARGICLLSKDLT
jgi:hypothetical protein